MLFVCEKNVCTSSSAFWNYILQTISIKMAPSKAVVFKCIGDLWKVLKDVSNRLRLEKRWLFRFSFLMFLCLFVFVTVILSAYLYVWLYVCFYACVYLFITSLLFDYLETHSVLQAVLFFSLSSFRGCSKVFFIKFFLAPFYGWSSTASRLEPLRRGSLLFTTKFPDIPGTHFINLVIMKGWVDLWARYWFWTRDP